MPHLFVDISSHGFGHLAQTGPVLDALATRLPDLRLTIRCALPREKLASRTAVPFEHVATSSDVAFRMHDAVLLDRAASAAAYRAAHADWRGTVETEASWLKGLAPDLVFANVSYLPLAGAARAGIPAVAMCSLNWADQFRHLFAGEAWADPILAEIDAAYASARLFLRCEPAMAMAGLANAQPIPPVVRHGKRRRAALEAMIGTGGERLVLVAMGGLGFDLPVEGWPRLDGVRWLVPASVVSQRPDITNYDVLPIHFADLVASVDALVTKPGYGSFVEAAASGTPVLYLRREHWPEQEVLIDWLQQNAAAAEVAPASFVAGSFIGQLQSLWQSPRSPVAADGAEVAAGLLAGLLTAGSRSA